MESLSCGSCSGEVSCQARSRGKEGGKGKERREGVSCIRKMQSIKEISVEPEGGQKKIKNFPDSLGPPLKSAASCC